MVFIRHDTFSETSKTLDDDDKNENKDNQCVDLVQFIVVILARKS